MSVLCFSSVRRSVCLCLSRFHSVLFRVKYRLSLHEQLWIQVAIWHSLCSCKILYDFFESCLFKAVLDDADNDPGSRCKRFCLLYGCVWADWLSLNVGQLCDDLFKLLIERLVGTFSVCFGLDSCLSCIYLLHGKVDWSAFVIDREERGHSLLKFEPTFYDWCSCWLALNGTCFSFICHFTFTVLKVFIDFFLYLNKLRCNVHWLLEDAFALRNFCRFVALDFDDLFLKFTFFAGWRGWFLLFNRFNLLVSHDSGRSLPWTAFTFFLRLTHLFRSSFNELMLLFKWISIALFRFSEQFLTYNRFFCALLELIMHILILRRLASHSNFTFWMWMRHQFLHGNFRRIAFNSWLSGAFRLRIRAILLFLGLTNLLALLVGRRCCSNWLLRRNDFDFCSLNGRWNWPRPPTVKKWGWPRLS